MTPADLTPPNDPEDTTPVPDTELKDADEFVSQIFVEEHSVPAEKVPDETRIDRIMEKALYETVVKDTTSFIFSSFGAALTELAGAVIRAGSTPPNGKKSNENPN